MSSETHLQDALAVLNRLFLSESISDLVLVVNSKQFHLHRCIVAESSDLVKRWLDSPLTDRQSNEDKEGKISINIDLGPIGLAENEDPLEMFLLYLKLMYSLITSSELSQRNALCVAAICNYMISPKLKEICEQHLISKLTVHEGVLAFAKLHSLTKVVNAALQLLAECEPLDKDLIPDLDNDDVEYLVNAIKDRSYYSTYSCINQNNFMFLISYCLNNKHADLTGQTTEPHAVANLNRFRRLHGWLNMLTDGWNRNDYGPAQAVLARLVPDPSMYNPEFRADFYQNLAKINGLLLQKLANDYR